MVAQEAPGSEDSFVEERQFKTMEERLNGLKEKKNVAECGKMNQCMFIREG